MKINVKVLALFIPFLFFLACGDLTDDDDGNSSSRSKVALSTTATLDLSGENISHFRIANDGEDNSIGIAAVGSDVYIFELEKGAKADSADIKITSYNKADSNSLSSLLRAASGSATSSISDIEVNPYTKQVYILAGNNRLYTFTVDSAGIGSVAAVDLSAVRGIKIATGTKLSSINDFAWDKAENQFYISYGTLGTLKGAIAWLEGPFASDTTSATYRQTIFTTNQIFQSYGTFRDARDHTAAPIEKISVATIGGKSFLSGENTCSPIFSEETANIRKSTAGGINFAQTFNMVTLTPTKIFHQADAAGTVYLMVIKDRMLSRVGQVFIDGTYNNDPAHSNANAAQKPGGFSPPGTTPLTLTESEYKEVVPSIDVTSAAAYGVGKVLILASMNLSIRDI